ncbi:dienelactone hydrolase family protein [Sphingosinithalassobacter sp. CS137]|uniref:dienelactone hydrolase family protein n=1 Tax=Sphingosinithalassobacter sp. CS137 TaxID=2762748 RepID=UPI00165E935B|nr:dienelactone hydrolase family protein [Sphingosinithalassobacter sp. CS137]
MTIRRETIVYDGPDGPFEGVAAYDDEWARQRPGVMIVPNVLGQKEADNEKAEALAALGYVGFACDTYGRGRRTTRESPDPAVYMNELNADRPLLRDRLHASLAAMRALPQVDPERCAAIGFCFGGKSVLDLARSGGDVLGVVSFHGIFDPPPYPVTAPIRAKLLICHGWDDPLAPPESVVALAAELTAAEADWQLDAYGHAGHSFTDGSARGERSGFAYDEHADRRSWQAMQDFLQELFV